MSSKKIYKHDSQTFNPETGEITHDSKYKVFAIDNEDDYIKVYKYLNTVFAFKGINSNLVPALMEISNYMTFADKGQTVILVKAVKDKIKDALSISTPRLDTIIRDLKKADILRPTGQRAEYAINPFIVARGKWSDIKELRSTFDYNSGLMTTQSIVEDKITGQTIAMITQEVKRNKNLIEGQTSFLNELEEDNYEK